MSFSSTPAYYRTCSFPVRNGVFYAGGTAPSVTLSGNGATGYEVRDFYGTIVSSASMSSSATTCTPAAPSGGWKPGWYRIYFTGPTNDATVGYAVAATTFCVIRDDARFPPFPASTTVTGYSNEGADPVAKGIMGLGHSRHIIGAYATYTSGDNLATAQAQVAKSKDYWSSPAYTAYTDPVRARPLWCATPGACADSLSITGSSTGTFLRLYPATPSVDGSQTFVAAAAGSSSGTKLTVRSPDSSTIVETYDNLASGTAAAAAMAASAYVKAFDGGQTAGAVTAATAIGRTIWNNIGTVVAALYPDVSRFELTNEPASGLEVVHQMRLFQAAVHAGNASAKAIGPCTVDMSTAATFLANGGGTYCDEISFHDYGNLGTGNLPLARATTETFLAAVTAAGQSAKALWQTEAGGAFSAVYGVHHPRRARVKVMHTLLWEQYGIPRERNPMWYDTSHGFWTFPCWWQYGDTSLTADAPLHRVLAEETFGMTHNSRLNLGTIGDNVALASLYAGSGGRCVVAQAASYIPDATLTITTSATGSLTVVDGFGNTTTATVSSGRVTIPLTEIPSYLRLPAGATASVYQVNDWPPVATGGLAWLNAGPVATPTGLSVSTNSTAIADGAYSSAWHGYGADGGNYDAGMPDSVTLAWPSAVRLDRLILWTLPTFQNGCSLTDFDIQTSLDGSTWTTRVTVTKTASSFLFGTSSTGTWCTRETYFDDQWIHDILLPAPVTCKYVRLYVRSTSLGGEPDLAALLAGGQAWNKHISLQEVAVLCDANTRPAYVRA